MKACIMLVFLTLCFTTFCHGAYDAPTATELAEVQALLKSCYQDRSTCPALDTLSGIPTAVRLCKYALLCCETMLLVNIYPKSHSGYPLIYTMPISMQLFMIVLEKSVMVASTWTIHITMVCLISLLGSTKCTRMQPMALIPLCRELIFGSWLQQWQLRWASQSQTEIVPQTRKIIYSA